MSCITFLAVLLIPFRTSIFERSSCKMEALKVLTALIHYYPGPHQLLLLDVILR